MKYGDRKGQACGGAHIRFVHYERDPNKKPAAAQLANNAGGGGAAGGESGANGNGGAGESGQSPKVKPVVPQPGGQAI